MPPELDEQYTKLDRGFRLGGWTVLPRQSSLSKGSETIHIEPRVMGVLVCLARHAPETVTRDEIFEQVWAGTVVQDEALSRNISVLRSHLRDDNSGRKFIQTVPRVGYRLLAEVAIEPPKLTKRISWMLAVTTIVLLVALLLPGQPEQLELPDFRFSIADLTQPVEPPSDFNSALRNTRLNSQILMLGDDSMLKRGAKDLRDSIRLFEQALRNDHELIEAHLGLANAYVLLPSYDPEMDGALMYARAKAELQAVVDLGIDTERTYGTEAFIHLRRLEWIKAEEKFRQAIEYDPDDAHLRQWYSQFLSRAGFIDASIKQAKISLGLDADSPVAYHRLGASYTLAGENELAEEQFSRAIRAGIAPYTYKEPKIMLLLRSEDFDEMEALIGAIQESQMHQLDWVPLFFDAVKNQNPEARRRVLAAVENAWRKKQINPTFYFGVHMVLDESKRTISLLNQLMVDGSLVDVIEGMFLPEMRNARAEPRFFTLMQELGLDDYWAIYGLPDMCRGEKVELDFCNRLTTEN